MLPGGGYHGVSDILVLHNFTCNGSPFPLCKYLPAVITIPS